MCRTTNELGSCEVDIFQIALDTVYGHAEVLWQKQHEAAFTWRLLFDALDRLEADGRRPNSSQGRACQGARDVGSHRIRTGKAPCSNMARGLRPGRLCGSGPWLEAAAAFQAKGKVALIADEGVGVGVPGRSKAAFAHAPVVAEHEWVRVHVARVCRRHSAKENDQDLQRQVRQRAAGCAVGRHPCDEQYLCDLSPQRSVQARKVSGEEPHGTNRAKFLL
jgi:hypothetical protein